MKRQEELQAQMDIAYWKKLVAKQKKLLEEQEHKAREIQVELQECDQGIDTESKGLRECNDAIAKWPILKDMIVTATRQVLDTRRALRNARKEEETNVAENRVSICVSWCYSFGKRVSIATLVLYMMHGRGGTVR